jgi:hypothetical protein
VEAQPAQAARAGERASRAAPGRRHLSVLEVSSAPLASAGDLLNDSWPTWVSHTIGGFTGLFPFVVMELH